MLGGFFQRHKRQSADLLNSKLYSDKTFYRAFEKDLARCKYEAIIESPFMTTRRTEKLLPLFRKAIKRRVRVIVITRDPYEHGPPYDGFAIDAIAELQSISVEVIYIGKHHRKLALFDRQILWEGSLNILSQNDSCEIMRRMHSKDLAMEMIRFLQLGRYI